MAWRSAAIESAAATSIPVDPSPTQVVEDPLGERNPTAMLTQAMATPPTQVWTADWYALPGGEDAPGDPDDSFDIGDMKTAPDTPMTHRMRWSVKRAAAASAYVYWML